MPTAAETLRAEIAAAIVDADAVIATAKAGGYATVVEVDAAVMAVRGTLAPLLSRVSVEWGVDGQPLHAALRHLAARLLDLRSAVSDATTTVDEELDRPASLVELAVKHYRDFSRWTELAALNPNLAHPGIIPAGTTVVRLAR